VPSPEISFPRPTVPRVTSLAHQARPKRLPVRDPLTRLSYGHMRSYDPLMGQFLSADTVQGNAQGMDPYAYVGENPETRTDPTGIGDGSLLACLSL